VSGSHHDLETVEALGLGGLDLGRESLDKVLVDDTVRLRVSKDLKRGQLDLQQQRKQGRVR
jgi:hypothetical protein